MISSDRMAHQLIVARDLVEQAQSRGTYSEQELQNLFVLGYLHDIGYEFATDPDDHAAIGGEVLKRLGFTYWAEVANHGNPEGSYSSAELDLLNSADMHTSSTGERVTYAERLQDIADRYGEDSPRYQNARTIIADLESKGL